MGWLVNLYQTGKGTVAVMTCDATADLAREKLMRLRGEEPIGSEWFEDRAEADVFLERVFKAGSNANEQKA